LRSALCGAAVKPLKIVPHALQGVALLTDLPKDSATLGWRVAEDREKA
jgi:hypothetical protein